MLRGILVLTKVEAELQLRKGHIEGRASFFDEGET